MNSITSQRRPTARGKQGGVVLIIALIMLVVVSMLATLSIRNATSSEAVSGAVRTTQLASQSAEIALRYCEDTLYAVQKGTLAAPANWAAAVRAYDGTVHFSDPKNNWDKVTAEVFVVPLTSVNSGSATFKRAPECMIENMRVATSTPPYNSTSTTYIITARGFGPEVSNDATRGRPDGTEVWLQSTVELN
ncbi:PilX N-terminal domain-containing pilus assembly protein [Caenimonas koreensis]|uniref:pilus assembly PilX family protein n=1 Tax=Caenimonas koreensis TaxID=367474 RepID=UPI003783A211